MNRPSFPDLRFIRSYRDIDRIDKQFVSIDYEVWHTNETGYYALKMHGSEKNISEDEARQINEERLEKLLKS